MVDLSKAKAPKYGFGKKKAPVQVMRGGKPIMQTREVGRKEEAKEENRESAIKASFDKGPKKTYTLEIEDFDREGSTRRKKRVKSASLRNILLTLILKTPWGTEKPVEKLSLKKLIKHFSTQGFLEEMGLNVYNAKGKKIFKDPNEPEYKEEEEETWE